MITTGSLYPVSVSERPILFNTLGSDERFNCQKQQALTHLAVDRVAFIALDVFQVFDEEAFEGAGTFAGAGSGEARAELGIFLGEGVEFFDDEVALDEVEAGDADGGRLGAF